MVSQELVLLPFLHRHSPHVGAAVQLLLKVPRKVLHDLSMAKSLGNTLLVHLGDVLTQHMRKGKRGMLSVGMPHLDAGRGQQRTDTPRRRRWPEFHVCRIILGGVIWGLGGGDDGGEAQCLLLDGGELVELCHHAASWGDPPGARVRRWWLLMNVDGKTRRS